MYRKISNEERGKKNFLLAVLHDKKGSVSEELEVLKFAVDTSWNDLAYWKLRFGQCSITKSF